MARQTNPKLLADFFNKIGRLCCKTRKLQRQEFFAKTRSGRRSPIRIPSVAVPKSPVSLTREDQSPHVFTRKTRLQPAEFLITCAKRLLQHNRRRHSGLARTHGRASCAAKLPKIVDRAAASPFPACHSWRSAYPCRERRAAAAFGAPP